MKAIFSRRNLIKKSKKSKENTSKPINRFGTIYIIKNKINDKVYIGQTTSPIRKRFKDHFTSAKHPRKCKYKFYLAINKHGRKNFYYEILEDKVPVYALDEKEMEYIKKYDSYHNGYNSTAGGDSPQIYKLEDQKTILEMLEAGFYYTELAAMYDVHKATIQRLAHKLGFRRNHRITGKELKKLFLEGKSDQEIADLYGYHKESIRRKRTKLNLRIRRTPVLKRDDVNFEEFKKDWNDQNSFRTL